MNKIAETFHRHRFLFTELVKRDFKKKYKRTYLGVFWSLLSPLLTLLVMRIVFTEFFGRGMEHYTTYLFCGNIVWAYFSDATNGGMSSLMDNAGVFTKINVPKYLFLFSRNVSSLINFSMTFIVFLIFCIIDGVAITPLFLTLIFPILCLIIFNVGVGLILSAMFIFFRDIQYLWGVFLTLLMYLSAIFYNPIQFGAWEKFFLLNPVY
ncbi:MAG: ABC transporter permease, partial [Clostridia bacterium]|nr:ABC transporter permease [Clostridia bacterium]